MKNSHSHSNSHANSHCVLPALVASLAACALFACAAPSDLDASASDALTHTLAPQSLKHGTARAATPSTFQFSGKAGDDVQPDVWPTAGAPNALGATLQLFGPADSSGTRPLLAQGSPGDEPGDISLELLLPQSGDYLLSVGAQAGHEGRFSLRFWTSGSAAPRDEAMRVSLALRPSDAVETALSAHSMVGPPDTFAWGADEVDAIAATIRTESDPLVAISDIAVLYSTLETAHQQGLATDALVEKAEALGADRVGAPADFAALPASAQTLAFYWLGAVQPAVFKSVAQSANSADQVTGLARVIQRIAALVASWSGAVEEQSARSVLALSRDGLLYGYQANWQAEQLDSDGKTVVFTWQSSDYFGADGMWLGESSQGAMEPDGG